MARWVQDNPGTLEGRVGHTIIASWLPWRYKVVMTIWCDGSSAIERLTARLRRGRDLAEGELGDSSGATSVHRCNSIGLASRRIFHQNHGSIQEAIEGHERAVRRFSKWYSF